jgi:hypothetical protein
MNYKHEYIEMQPGSNEPKTIICLDTVDEFRNLLSSRDCIFSDIIITTIESAQRKGLSRCTESDLTIGIQISDITQIVRIQISKSEIDHILDVNLQNFEEHEHYEQCARILRLKKRISNSRKRKKAKEEKALKEILKDISEF